MKRGNILALDYGTKRIGLAVGDFETKMAFPKGVIQNKGFDFVLGEIISFCKEWDVRMIVVGLPIDMKYTADNEMTKKIKKFVVKLGTVLQDIDIELFDESLSTFEAEDLMDKSDVFKDKRAHKDELAAQIILHRFFASLCL